MREVLTIVIETTKMQSQNGPSSPTGLTKTNHPNHPNLHRTTPKYRTTTIITVLRGEFELIGITSVVRCILYDFQDLGI